MDEHNRTDYPGGPDTPVETPIAPPAPAEGDRTAQPVPEAPAAQEADPVRDRQHFIAKSAKVCKRFLCLPGSKVCHQDAFSLHVFPQLHKRSWE